MWRQPGGSVDEPDYVAEERLDVALSADRIQLIRSKFQDAFSQPPEFFLRVPGRVNLIGEHIDYCGYAVLPMAISYSVVIAGRAIPTDSKALVKLVNVNDKYSPFQCAVEDAREILGGRKEGEAPEWHLYFLCGLVGVMEMLKNSSHSLELCIDGRVPERAGLSSSSALVCASTLATLVGNNVRLTKKEVADLSARSERFIGTAGGGMDQAIAMLATAGCAQFIEFVPTLSATSVLLPAAANFVVAHSLAEANKAANDSYNYRVTECRFATYVLAHAKGLQLDEMSKPLDLQVKLRVTLDQLLQLVDKELHKEAYTVKELEQKLGVDSNWLREKSSIKSSFSSDLTFKLRQRIQHVYSEAGRVELFRAICKEESASGDILHQLGRLMNMSHQSLRELYECSHPMLDSLVHLAQSCSHGARLTGAGWGGCIVALVDANQLDRLLHTLKTKYYDVHFPMEDISPYVFVTTPSQGASILKA